MDLSAFKAYDIRGHYPSLLNEELAKQLGYAYAREIQARQVVIGHDARCSGPALYGALAEGLRAAGAAVTGIGLCATEEIYYATFAQGFDGGIMVTGSHNPAEENGFKMVRKGAVPISGNSGLFTIRDRIAAGQDIPSTLTGSFAETSFRSDYLHYLTGYIQPKRSFHIVADAGNGCAGLIVRGLAARLPFHITLLHGEPDGRFPHGVPNPLLPEKREATSRAVRELGADFGIAWDGDADRCFFYDETGRFIEGYYLVGLIAEALLARQPGAKIIHDPRLVWNTRELVARSGGIAIESRTGHAFIKERMREEHALYGGEMSAHHYFRDFAYCDSGMIPWLCVAQLLSDTGMSLAACVEERMRAFPCSGEINSRVENAQAVLARVEKHYATLPRASVSHIDGLSVAFDTWRFNLRASNTEALLRLNVESRGDLPLLQRCTQELLRRIRSDTTG